MIIVKGGSFKLLGGSFTLKEQDIWWKTEDGDFITTEDGEKIRLTEDNTQPNN